MSKSMQKECPQCGIVLPSGTAAGQCPRCILQFVAARETGNWNTLEQEIPDAAIGAYRLIEKLGEGGMAVVYLAEQEKPLRREVALKITKLGMDTRQFVARFDTERQALAIMEHPNIARVFDAGATETGRPYFAMELVHGVSITQYCERQRLGTRERLKLFIPVCQAIQHAHDKGVIHRDIKPSNVLVTLQDETPIPKVIDFGVAKALNQRLSVEMPVTEQGQFLGTPEYMSPEQAESSGQNVDTRTDLYSLGVLLYELLTGCTPFDSESLRGRGYAQMQRIICEQDPVKPSTKLTMLGGKLEEVARDRSTTAEHLRKSVRRDLDLIVMKCLEKDPARRYETATDLGMDIERHLQNEPVTAVAPTQIYLMERYFRRHRRTLLTAAAFALLIILGIVFGVWQARRAGRAEEDRANLRNVQWALGTAMPEIERLLEQDDYTAAFNLVEQARPFVADDLRFQSLSTRAGCVISVDTMPPGAEVLLRNYSDATGEWTSIGTSPLNEIRVPRGFTRWRITLPKYESAEGALFIRSRPVELQVRLDETGTIPAGMTRIQGRSTRTKLSWLDHQSLPVLNLTDFLFDRYEVTNRQFKAFIEAGAYQNPEYWKYRFIKDDVEIAWQAAMRMFLDQTGRPGPATWAQGDFPAGQEDYPVSGVSWYEAAAYAEFAGKCLPTVYHWSLAAGDRSYVDVGFVIPLSNFGGQGPAATGTYQGMSSLGIYDMAGNVKEWCFNETPNGHRVMAGGAWNEPEYMFQNADRYAPCFREANFGFRCMKVLTDDDVWEQAGTMVQYSLPPEHGDLKPCSDEVFDAYKRLYDYNRSELQPVVETTENLSIYTRQEKVSFSGAYGDERMIAYLYIPRRGKPPFQTVLFYPGDGAWSRNSISGYGTPDTYESHTRSGRAFVFPVLQGTFERKAPPDQPQRTTDTENWIMRVKDFRRTIDYLETRPQVFDLGKLAYEGLSRGASWGGVLPAIEPRIKVAVMFGGGLHLDFPPEYSQVNFAARIKIPILLQGGEYDFIFPVESSQKPYLELFATPAEDKHHKTYSMGHSCWFKNEVSKDELAFLDRYLGPVN